MDAKYLGEMPASPVVDTLRTEHGDTYTEVCYGLTKREAFAMAAMQALIGTAAAPCLGGLEGFEPHTATAACRMADAILAELAKEQP